MNDAIHFDVIVIGSGAAGLGLALRLAHTYQIAVLCKDNLQTSASERAQGGIAAVMSQTDSLHAHITDTINAGAGLCDPVTVDYTVKHAKEAILQLIDYGIQFTTTSPGQATEFHLTREGGHTHRRILHAADKTGAAVVKTLLQQVQDHPNIHCFTEITALDLITEKNKVQGVILFNNLTHELSTLNASVVVLATGGASTTYLHTTNPSHTSGDGIGIAFNAGARIANMEFNQFHPTCLYNPNGETLLITKAMRGEGAKLILPDGTRFMPQYDARAELAPRDIVSRAIHNEMKKHALSHVLLDISFEAEDKIKSMFPFLYHKCLALKLDLTQSPIPVVPAAHYTCGGVLTNLQGQTDVPGLYAVGEVACTGLHGANRMASNSLLECLVFANSAAAAIEKRLAQQPKQFTVLPPVHWAQHSEYTHEISRLRTALRTLMWDHVGIERSQKSLQHAADALCTLTRDFNELWQQAKLSKELIELRNIALNARLIIDSARRRKESRGTHYNRDYPETQATALNTVITPGPLDEPLQIEYTPTLHQLVQPNTLT